MMQDEEEYFFFSTIGKRLFNLIVFRPNARFFFNFFFHQELGKPFLEVVISIL